MPTYQGKPFLPLALDSIAGQFEDDIELIVVDDGSTDGTLDILDSYAGKIPLRIIRQTHGGNWVKSTNLGFSEASGTYLCMLHQDDLWLPGRIAAMRELSNTFPEAGLLLASSIYVDHAGRQVGPWRPPLQQTDTPIPSHELLRQLIVQNFIALPSPIFRRDCFTQVGAMDEALWFLADWKLWGQLGALGTTVYHDEPLTAFRIHPASQTAKRTHDEEDLRPQYLDVIESMAAQLPDSRAKRRAIRAAHLSKAVSIALAMWSHGRHAAACRELARQIEFSPLVWNQFIRDSRILERVGARLRIQASGGSRPARRDAQ